MNVEQLYSDMMEYNVSPSVFEFDEKPANTHIDMAPQYQDNSLSGKLMRQLGFQAPYKSPEELQKEAELEQQRQEEELERQRREEEERYMNELYSSNIFEFLPVDESIRNGYVGDNGLFYELPVRFKSN